MWELPQSREEQPEREKCWFENTNNKWAKMLRMNTFKNLFWKYFFSLTLDHFNCN